MVSFDRIMLIRIVSMGHFCCDQMPDSHAVSMNSLLVEVWFLFG